MESFSSACQNGRHMELGLKDRVAIVAASSQGLGKAVALGLAREGARLAICSRNAALIERTAVGIADETGAQVLARVVDVRDASQVGRFVSDTAENFGRIDICIANAGGPPSRRFEETGEDDWRGAFDLTFMSTFHFAKHVFPHMKARQWGRFIVITSVVAREPAEGLIYSNALRAGVSGLVKSLANEYGPYNILVNGVCPGYTKTARLEEIARVAAATESLPPSEIEARWAQKTPLGRVGTPQEFADVVVFLASERSAYITGSAIAVDGGLLRSTF